MYLVLTIVGRVGLLWAQILAICILQNLKVHIKGAHTFRSELYNNNEILVRTEWVCEDDLCSLVVKNNNRDQSSCSKMLNSIL